MSITQTMTETPSIQIPVDEPKPEVLCVDIKEAARRLSCEHGFIRKLIRRGKLKRLQDSRHILIPVSSLEAYVKQSAR